MITEVEGLLLLDRLTKIFWDSFQNLRLAPPILFRISDVNKIYLVKREMTYMRVFLFYIIYNPFKSQHDYGVTGTFLTKLHSIIATLYCAGWDPLNNKIYFVWERDT